MIILIDDDILMHMGWKLKASKTGAGLKCYSSIQDFLNEYHIYPKHTPIYIDSDLGNGVLGENESKIIYNLGFDQIYLSTGYSKHDFELERYPWLKDVVTKSPPF